MAAKKTIQVKLVRGLAGKRKTHIETVKSLGLRKTGQVVEVPNTPETIGQIRKVHHLVNVVED